MSRRRSQGVRRGFGWARLSLWVLLGTLTVPLAAACYSGGEREKEPPPGFAGGLCRSDPGESPCEEPEWLCQTEGGYCYDPADPCLGFFCGGPEAGECFANAQGLPQCMCEVGYSNQQYALVCEPVAGASA